jgi:hypothetical protein
MLSAEAENMALKVIGAGLGRTGTLSLKVALEQLGLGRCHHMMEVFMAPATIDLWRRAGLGEPTDWDALLEGFGCAVDWPSAEFYAQLAERYPDAKVILTTRDAESWFKSTQATIFADSDAPMPPGFKEMITAIIGAKFDGRLHDRDHCIAVYEAHNAKVRASIPPERLLEYQAGQGWEPLCAFLGVPVPDAPYPKSNSTEEFVQRRAAMAAH